MKMWVRVFGIVVVIVIATIVILQFRSEKKECCLCDSFRYHAPCLIDLETGDMVELNLYIPHRTLVAELAEEQPEMGTFSFVKIGNVSGTKVMNSKTVQIHIPDDKTYAPALCGDCRKKLPAGDRSRYIFADLYREDEKVLIPVRSNSDFFLRCYHVVAEKETEKGGILVTVQGLFE